MSSQKSRIRVRFLSNWIMGQDLLDGNMADLVVLVYDFSGLESTTPYTQIYCNRDSNRDWVQEFFPEARLVSYHDGKWCFHLDGEGEQYKSQLLDALRHDYSWDFIDLRYESEP